MAMTNSRKFRKIALRSEYLSLEESEFEEMDVKYMREFNEDFHRERTFLIQHKNPAKQEKSNKSLFEITKKTLKKLHVELAKATHPDTNPEISVEEFTKIQNAYEEGDGATLVESALRFIIELDIAEEDIKAMEQQLVERQEQLKKRQQMAHWVWCTSSKNDKLRTQVRYSMGIAEDAFAEWLAKNS